MGRRFVRTLERLESSRMRSLSAGAPYSQPKFLLQSEILEAYYRTRKRLLSSHSKISVTLIRRLNRGKAAPSVENGKIRCNSLCAAL